MSSRAEVITPNALRDWALPSGADSKYARGNVVVIGGARKTPGAALLAGVSALRVGAGRLTLGVAESVAIPLAVAVPESGVVGLAETASGSLQGTGIEHMGRELERADVVIVGSGLDDADEAAALIRTLLPLVGDDTRVVLDAYALTAVAGSPSLTQPWAGRLVFTPNKSEAATLLERGLDDLENDRQFDDAVAAIAERYGAVVTCFQVVAAPGGERWHIGSGQGGLGTSGSGDVLAGAIGGLLARGAAPDQAACWGTHLHATAGDRLAARIGPTGYLARELIDELPSVLVELGQRV
ncbi:MAG TPA: NAD(P)H-hydrate dehydratase [Glaciibacter sp.]|nr:NAD(P)H-hydrate dehydratase [Glaciibacter sp.]